MKNRQFFSQYKYFAGSPVDLVLPLGNPLEAIIRPVATEKQKINPRDVALLSAWRNRFVKSFLTEFHAHDRRTTSWLIDNVGNDPGKILFMIDTLEKKTIGHIGLGFINWQTGYVEADAIVRGGNARKGLMKDALQLLLQWAKTTLGLDDTWVRVRSDNPAVLFYEKVGFVEKKRVPIMEKKNDGNSVWTEDPHADRQGPALVYMKYTHPNCP